jgi:hypothetical protein
VRFQVCGVELASSKAFLEILNLLEDILTDLASLAARQLALGSLEADIAII